MNESSENSKNLFQTYGWQLIWPLISFLIPYVIAFVFFLVAGLEENGKIIQISPQQALYEAIKCTFATFLSFILVVFSSLAIVSKKSNSDQNKLMHELVSKTFSIKKDVDFYLQKAKIVFESGINEYNDKHLLALRRILNILEKDTPVNIYAIDNSDPRSWWSDTMTGYLALLANWKSQDTIGNRRSVFRIFVCQKNELLSPIFAKTISLHSLMGFKTYIITNEQFNSIYSEFIEENGYKLSLNREVLIWLKSDKTKDGENIETPIEVSFNLDKLGQPKMWNSVKCYQSFWKIGSDYNRRNELMNKDISEDIPNYYNHPINSNEIDIWFEFVAKEKNNSQKVVNKTKNDNWGKIPIAYASLIQILISKMECCKDSNEVRQIDIALPYGIEIKTSSCSECVKKCGNETSVNGMKFDFTSASDVRDILKEYYNKLN